MSLFSKKIIGLDFHDYYAQVVEMELSGNVNSLLAFNRVVIPPQVIRDGEIVNQEELKNIITTLLETANPKAIKVKNVICSFPERKVFTHIFKFPVELNPKEIEKALPFEAENVIPFLVKDIYWDFRILHKDPPKTPHASQYVLFASVQKQVADSYVKLLTSAGLNPYAFTIHAECVENALKNQIERIPSSLVIDIGYLATTYSVFNRSELKNVFTSMESGKGLVKELAEESQLQEFEIINQKEKNNFDPSFIPQIEKFENKIFEETKVIIKDIDVKTIFLTGEFLNLPGFYDNAKKAFPDKEILPGDPRLGIKADADKFTPLDKNKGAFPYSVYFSTAIGLAVKGLNAKDTGINLLPDRLKASFASKKLSLLLVLISISLAIVSLVLSTLVILKHQEFSFQRVDSEGEKSSLQQLIYGTRYQEIKRAITDFNSEVTALTTIQSSLFSVPELLKNIVGSIPKGATISSLEFNNQDLTVNISGIANTRETLLNTRKKLEEEPYVEKVIAPLSNFDEKENISFILKLELKFNELKPYAWNGIPK
ncbi:MAG: pilus assembly protein PilM [Candidatus Peregrinibacteria bacterium]|nr:pilus assembly protein PilM [Candidatus Peregrinibacteria bacterium]